MRIRTYRHASRRGLAFGVRTTSYDAIIVGGGPSGSTCARVLTAAGARVAVVDRAMFPRVKLCAGWVSPGIWHALDLAAAEYTGGLWEWRTCHVRYRERIHAIACHGWFIRRCELDDFLLRRSGADLHLGVAIKHVERGADGIWSIDGLRARFLIGAGGTHCPVAKLLAPARPKPPVGVQELELESDASAIERTRLGDDGEPELLLFDDGGGYGWNVPKSSWLNVGCGTLDANDVRRAWRSTLGYLRAAGHVPVALAPELARAKGHTYYLFAPAHLDRAAVVDDDGRGGAFLVGDALGLAHPITAEGILPAVISGRHLGRAIAAGDPASYVDRLRRDPVLADYRRLHAAIAIAGALRRRWPARRGLPISQRLVARSFAWMFSGAQLPVPRLLDRLLV